MPIRRGTPAKVEEPQVQQIRRPLFRLTPQVLTPLLQPTRRTESKQVAEEKSQVAAEEKVVKKQEKATKQKAAERQQEDAAAAAERDRARAESQSAPEHPDQPEIPDANPVDAPRPRRTPTTRRVGDVIIRNFPDGTQVIISPDGTASLCHLTEDSR